MRPDSLANGGSAPPVQTGNQNPRPRRLILVILKKEFREIIRDKRTIISVFISPLVVTPGMFAIMGVMVHSQTEKARTQTVKIGIVGAPINSRLIQQIASYPNITLVPAAADLAENQIIKRQLDAAAVLPRSYDRYLSESRTLPIRILLDVGDQNSQTAARRVEDAFSRTGEQMVDRRLSARRLPSGLATPFQVSERPVEHGGTPANFLLSMMLPYVLAISAFSGAIYAAFDQVAGEKERGSLETLLVSPASRRDIVLGKFGAVCILSLINCVLTIVGLAMVFVMPTSAFQWLSKGGLHLTAAAIIAILLVLLPLSVLFAGLLLAVSTFAHNQKEAQTYLAPLFVAVLLPAMMSVFIGSENGLAIAFVPILNASIIMKQALTGSYHVGFIAIAFTTSAFYAGLALVFATRLFQKEGILIKA